MTLEDIKKMDCETITPAVAAQVLGMNPHYIRVAARTKPELLGFPTIVYQAGRSSGTWSKVRRGEPMKYRGPPQIRDFQCDECGVIVQATKRRGRRTNIGHIKHMWGYRCRKCTAHTQVSLAK